MKNVEEERSRAQAENSLLQEEMRKLRDILKQAMAEAIGAKEAASFARAENSQLKNLLAEKDTALNFVSRELKNQKLRAFYDKRISQEVSGDALGEVVELLKSRRAFTRLLCQSEDYDKMRV